MTMAAQFAANEAIAADPAMTGNLRQMIAALEEERQALAALDSDRLYEATRVKDELCAALAPLGERPLDPQTRDLVETARTLNDVNRRVRNLLAANVAARLDALGGGRPAYSASISRLATA